MSDQNATLKALMEKIQALETENARLKSTPKSAAPFKLAVSTKGAVSIYGLGRFPVTLYASQMERVLERRDEILAFIKTNAERLVRKPA